MMKHYHYKSRKKSSGISTVMAIVCIIKGIIDYINYINSPDLDEESGYRAPLTGDFNQHEDPNEPLIKPAEPFARSFFNWVYWSFWREPLTYPRENSQNRQASRKSFLEELEKKNKQSMKAFFESISYLLSRAFLMTYGFDGYDLTNSDIAYTNLDGGAKQFRGRDFSAWLLLASFFGLPTRPEANLSYDGVSPKLTFKQLLTNFIGGWADYPLYVVCDVKYCKSGIYGRREKTMELRLNEKAVWQIISIPFKFCVILPIKILAVPVKLSINIIKLFTEFLPMVILPFLRMILWQLVVLMSFIVVLLADSICNLVEISDDILISVVCVIILIPMIILLSLIFIVLTIPIAGLIIALRIIQLVGRAITSPEKNAKIAFAHGRELGGEIGGLKIGNVIGALGALISILITAVAWANVLPLAYGAIISHYPIVLQLLTWVFQLPIVVSFLGAIQSALTTVSVAIIPALSPVVIALSTYLGIKVSAIALMYGLLVAPVVVILSRIGDELSNWWASSHKGGPFTSIGNIVIDLLQKCTATDATARLQSQSKSVEPSQKARHLCLDKNDAFDSTLRRFRMVDSATAVTMPVLFGDFESTTDLAEPPMLQQWYYSAIPK